MARRKRIHNPKTKTYLKIAQRSGKKHRRGQIMGKWSPRFRRKR